MIQLARGKKIVIGITGGFLFWLYFLVRFWKDANLFHKGLPVWLLILFGMYSVLIVLYHVFTFNNCPEEIDVLRKEIAIVRQKLKASAINTVDTAP